MDWKLNPKIKTSDTLTTYPPTHNTWDWLALGPYKINSVLGVTIPKYKVDTVGFFVVFCCCFFVMFYLENNYV